jgi:hypothetical protein
MQIPIEIFLPMEPQAWGRDKGIAWIQKHVTSKKIDCYVAVNMQFILPEFRRDASLFDLYCLVNAIFDGYLYNTSKIVTLTLSKIVSNKSFGVQVNIMNITYGEGNGK